ncbi:MAG: hypothetical protein R2873_31580 [Caldilineaceae bacterium]
MRLGGVFDNGDAVIGGNGVDGGHICGLAVDVYRHDSASAA